MGKSTQRRRSAAPLKRQLRKALVVAATASLVNSALWAAPAAAVLQLTPVRQIGSSGHAGLYGWGMATMSDGSVLVGDYWNFRIVHYASDGTNLGDVVTAGTQGGAPGEHQSPYGIAVDPRDDSIYFGDVDGNKTVDKYDENGNFLLEWGGSGSGPGKFKYPSYVSVASDGNVYVSDQWDHNIVVSDPDGNELFQFGSQGSGNGQFKQPRGNAFDAQDRLFVVDNYNGRIQVFDAQGTFLYKFGGTGSDPGDFGPGKDLRGIAIDKSNGWVYVVDAATGYVNKYDLDGNFLLRFGGFGSGSGEFVGGGRGVTIDGTGNVWVGDMPGFRAQVFSPSGQFLFAVPDPPEPPPDGGFNQPRGVAVDSQGNIFVTDTHNWRIEKFSPSGQFLLQWGHRGGGVNGFNYQRGIAVDLQDDSVVVADTDNHLIKKYTNDGSIIWSVGGFGTALGKFTNPHSLDVGPDGRIYVVDTQNQRVQVLASDGTPLYAFGSKGSGDGQFQFPRGITVDADGSLWVSDSIRGVVQHFTKSGAYLGRFGSFGSADDQLKKAADVEVDGTYVYVADALTHRIKVWTKAGTFMGAFGGFGSAPGKLANPHGMELTPDGHLYVAEQGGERVQELLVSDQPPDTVPPNGLVTTPTNGQVFTTTPVAMAGTATDDVGVSAVKVAIKDRVTGLWYRSDGTWGGFQNQDSTLGSPGAASTTWDYSWTPAPGGSGSYALQVTATDGAANTDPTKPWVTFSVSS